ncbi:Fic family protein [Fusobacterium gastrosuis]|uniref:Fic family protein n=1 Tax=Fusobacterium gastrosuis TaxID=1755100 RepID=UPI002A9BADE2|nr:Fic family protein [Fusobacterium gastrosuis]
MKNLIDKITEEYKKDLLVRMSHHSTAIEGNTLTQAETISILIHNYIPKSMTEREYYEVKNYKKAFNFLLDADKELTSDIIRKYNKYIMENLREDNGQFKKIQNIILGSSFETTKPYLVPTVIEEWCQNLKYRLNNAKTTEEKIEAILEQHIRFEKIHPFGDGNGRTGRILIIHSCLKEGIAPIIIPKEEKGRYINTLANEDIREFKEWGIELQQKEKKRIEIIFNNTEFNLKKSKEKGIER